MRDLVALPKAHLHLHLTGGMRPATLADLAAEQGRRLPAGLLDPAGARVDVTGLRGWNRFQRLYDAARELLVGPDQVRRVVRELVEDEAAAGSGWLELQVDPTTYAPRLGGLQAAVELVLDALAEGSRATGVGTALVVAGNRTRHPGDAETLARLARRFAGRGVVGFGLSNDETRGVTAEFAKAFRLARDAGLVAVPHAGELRGPRSVREAVDALGARRLGHGVRAVEDPALLDAARRAAGGLRGVPGVQRRARRAAGRRRRPGRPAARRGGAGRARARTTRCCSAPGWWRSTSRRRTALGLDDAALADLAACSVRGSTAPADVQRRLLDGIDAWLAAPAYAPRGRTATPAGGRAHIVVVPRCSARRSTGHDGRETHRTSGMSEAAGEGAPRPPGGPVSASSGVLYVHSCPPAIVPHVEWAVAAELGVRASLRWTDQPAAPGALRAESGWQGRAGTAGRLAAALRGWKVLRYEVTEQASPGLDGERWSVTPGLGVFRSATSANGDLLVGEDRLRALLATRGRPGPRARDRPPAGRCLGRRARAVPPGGRRRHRDLAAPGGVTAARRAGLCRRGPGQ